MSPKALMIIAPTQFRDEELNVPRAVMEEAGFEVDVASTRLGECDGMLGHVEVVSLTVDTVNENNYDAVAVVGGMGSIEHLFENAHIHRIVQSLNSQNKVVAGICLSGAVLANAGVLKGKKATVWRAEPSLAAYEKGQVAYIPDPVVQDGNAITADGPNAAQAFGEAIVAKVRQAVSA